MAKGCIETSPRAVLFLLTTLWICLAPIGAPTTSWAASEWALVEANENTRVSCIAFDPVHQNTLYLGNSCTGLSKSTDEGNTWALINNGLSFTQSGSCSPLCSLVIDPQNTNTLYAGWNDPSDPNAPMIGLWKTTDGGQNWSRIESGVGCRQILSLAIDPYNPALLYAGTSCGVFKSTNGGGSWSAANQGIAVTEIGALAVAPQNTQTVYAATSIAIYKSVNGGSSWSVENSALNFNQVRGLVVDPQNSAVLYVGSSQGVWKSSDSGKTWMEMNGGLTDRGIRTLAIDPQDPGYLYAWTNAGMYQAQLIGASTTGAQASIAASSSSTQPMIAINCGGPQVTANSGMVYQVDSGFTGGQTYSTTAAISGTDDPKVYQTERYGNFSYKFTVVNGNYTVVLKFAEIYENAANRRKFTVKIEGREVLSSLDLYAQVGKNKAYDVTIPVTVSDGELNIDFITVQGNAKISAIVVAPVQGTAQGGITQSVGSSSTAGSQAVSSTQSTSTQSAATITSSSSAVATKAAPTAQSTSTLLSASRATPSTPTTEVSDPYRSEFLRCNFDENLDCRLVSDGSSITQVSQLAYLSYREGVKSKGLYTGNVVYGFWDVAKKEAKKKIDNPAYQPKVNWRDNDGGIVPTVEPLVKGWSNPNSSGAMAVIANALSLGPAGLAITNGSDGKGYGRALFIYPGPPNQREDGYVQGQFSVNMPSATSDSIIRFEAKVGYAWLPSPGDLRARIRLGISIDSGVTIDWREKTISYGDGVVPCSFEFTSNYSGRTVDWYIRVETVGDRTGDRILIIDPAIRSYKRAGDSVLPAALQSLIYTTPDSFPSEKGSLSMWVRPFFDSDATAGTHVLFRMAKDGRNRLNLILQNNKLVFSGKCLSPSDCEEIYFTDLDKTIGDGDALEKNTVGHYAWKRGQWHQITAVWSNTKDNSGPKGMRLYVDGGLVSYKDSNTTRFSGANTPGEIYLGATGGNFFPFDGVIDDVRLYNDALTDWDVEQLFKIDYYGRNEGGTVEISKFNSADFGGITDDPGVVKVQAGTKGTLTLTYTVPAGGDIAAGGGVLVINKGGEWPSLQTDSPCWPGYTKHKLIPGAENSTSPTGKVLCGGTPRLGSTVCEFTLERGILQQGDQVKFFFGYDPTNRTGPVYDPNDDPVVSPTKCDQGTPFANDPKAFLCKSGGSASEGVNKVFNVAVNRGGEGGGFYFELPKANQLKARVVSSANAILDPPRLPPVAKRLAATAPSNVILDKVFSIVVVAEDEFRNPVSEYADRIEVFLDESGTLLGSCGEELNAPCQFEGLAKGYARLKMKLQSVSEGAHWLRVKSSTLTAYSNVFYVSSGASEYKLYWGDLHAHSTQSDGILNPRSVYNFMRDVANLDFAASGDHIGNPGDVYNSIDFGNFPSFGDWQDLINAAGEAAKDEDKEDPGGKIFVSFPGYEYSQGKTARVVPCVRDYLKIEKVERHNKNIFKDKVYPACWGWEEKALPDRSKYGNEDDYLDALDMYNEFWSEKCKRFRAYFGGAGQDRWPYKDYRKYWDTLDYPEMTDIPCGFDGDWNVYFRSPAGLVANDTLWCPNSVEELIDKAGTWAGQARTPGNKLDQVLIVLHHGGRHANMDKIRPDLVPSLIPAVEIISGHASAPGGFEAWAQHPLKNGAKVGFIGSSDNHAGTAGIKPGGFIGVWATDLTRKDIFDAIKNRRTVAASRPDRPYVKATLTVRGTEHWMGEDNISISRGDFGELNIEVGSVGGVEKVEVILNEQVVKRFEGIPEIAGDHFTLRHRIYFTFDSRVYVKVIQKPEKIVPGTYTDTSGKPINLRAEGVAWSSPIFVTVTDRAGERTIFESGWEGTWIGAGGTERCEMAFPPKDVNGYFDEPNRPYCSTDVGTVMAINGNQCLQIAGKSKAPYAYAYYKVFDVNIDIVNGTKIGYWINFHLGPPDLDSHGVPKKGSPEIAVDGNLTKGDQNWTIRDFGNGVLADQRGIKIHPAARQWYADNGYMDQWHYVEVDLSPAAGWTLNSIFFGFDNGGNGYQEKYMAFIDDLRIVKPGTTSP